MRKHTLVSRLTTRFTFIELALRRVPIFTRRSRAGKFQIISTRLSKNGPIVTFASDTSLPRRTSTSWRVWLGWRGGSVLWCLCTILGFVTETASVCLRTLAFFLSTGNRYLFLLQRRLIPFDSWSLLLIQFSHVWRQSRYFLMNLHGVQFQCFFELIRLTYTLHLYRLSKASSDGIFDTDSRTSSHLVSNS